MLNCCYKLNVKLTLKPVFNFNLMLIELICKISATCTCKHTWLCIDALRI